MPVVPRQWDAGAVRQGWTYRSSTLLPGTITNLKITVMTKNYYRSEYSDKQWKALIDKATELSCQIIYSKYGNIVTIDSTDRESQIIAQTGRGEQDRAVWAERIHGMIQESTNLKVWKVQPKRYHKGYCPTICKSRRVAEFEQERLERITGFEWAIKVMME